MANWFDKVTDAARKIQAEVEKSGLLDKAPGKAKDAQPASTGAAATARGAPSVGSSPDTGPEDDVFARATAHGVVDPTTLLGPADAADATGVPFDTACRYYDDEWIGTTITSSQPRVGGYVELRAAMSYGGEALDPDAMWDFLCSELVDREELAGIADTAFRAGDVVYFRWGSQVLFVMANLPDGSDVGETCTALAHLVVERLQA